MLDSGLRDDQRPPRPLIISARLSDGLRPVRLKLDSGANESFLYRPTEYLAIGNFRGASLPGRGVDGKQRILTELPTQGLQIGQTVISRVPFFTLLARQDDHTSDFDGLLSTGVFRSIFIDRANHFVVIDPL